MKTPQIWKSLKIKADQYDALAECSEATGKSILKLGEEALSWYIGKVVPVYLDSAKKAEIRIHSRMAGAGRVSKKTAKPSPKQTQTEEIERVTIAS
jgi:hypothetical protein